MSGATTPSTVAVTAVLGAAAAGVLLPDRIGLGRRSPFVEAIAFRPQVTALTLVVAAGLAGRRSGRAAAAALGAVATAGLAAVAAARIAHRPPVATDTATGAPPAEITILTGNVLHGRADRGALTTLIERNAPDFVVLPEAGPDFRDKLMPPLEILGYRSWVSTGAGTADGRSVTLLAGPRAGELQVRVGTGMRLAHLEATGGVLGARTLYAVHTTAPVRRRNVARWRRDLAVLGGWCAATPAPVVVGDLNATSDHPSLREVLGGCRSAAGAGPRGLIGTFPARLPRALGIQIDHVLVPAAARTTRFEIVDLIRSDHRAVLATVRLPSYRSPAAADPLTSSITI
ncbi:MAG TPA: endonuclease/exonuclease/phosphatase family protein [Pseudonocardia sp.]|nr:endonuclease/exonuclease/phosphatase family protein [Pseudonocardia sp.]